MRIVLKGFTFVIGALLSMNKCHWKYTNTKLSSTSCGPRSLVRFSELYRSSKGSNYCRIYAINIL